MCDCVALYTYPAIVGAMILPAEPAEARFPIHRPCCSLDRTLESAETTTAVSGRGGRGERGRGARQQKISSRIEIVGIGIGRGLTLCERVADAPDGGEARLEPHERHLSA